MKNILCVDDSPSMRQILRSCLEKEGYRVYEAEDGLDGLNKVHNIKFNLYIVDYHMPRMDGISFIKEVRKKNGDIPIIMLTTESHDDKKSEGKQAGANGWIVKPFKPEQLIKIVERMT